MGCYVLVEFGFGFLGRRWVREVGGFVVVGF